MSGPLRVAVLGAGYFARFHYEAWSRIEDAKLVAAADHDPGKAAEMARLYSIGEVHSDVATMLDAVRPEVLDIAVPPAAHLPAIEAAVARGIPVICQKPFCGSLAGAERAAALSASSGIPVIVHENFRFQPWHREIRRLLDEDAIGDVYQATFLLRPGDGQGEDAYLSRQPYFQKMQRFLVHETAVHFVDVFRYLFGEVTSVYADLRRLNPVIAGEDAGTFLLGFDGGVRALFDGNRLADHVADDCRLTMGDMLVEGARGVLRLDGRGNVFHRRKASTEETPTGFSWQRRGFAGDSVRALQSAAVEGLLGRRPIENLAADYLANLRVEDAIYRSNETGRKIRLGS